MKENAHEERERLERERLERRAAKSRHNPDWPMPLWLMRPLHWLLPLYIVWTLAVTIYVVVTEITARLFTG